MSKLWEVVRQYGPFIARILLAAIFLISGYDKIGGFSMVAGFMASKGIPLSEIALALSIVLEIGGGLLLIAGWKARWAAAAIFVWLIPVTLIFHNFWAADAAEYQNQLNHFLKNLCIVGGMLYVMAYGAGPLSMDNRRI
jgi:putative oxidoreductase